MDRAQLVDWIKGQTYVGKRFIADEEEQTSRLYRSLDRFATYLLESCGITQIEDTTLEALQGFDHNLPENDDEHLRLAFDYLGRDDLTTHMAMVSADKYFQNKTLTVVFRAFDDLKGYIKDLRKADIRLAAELLQAGATPEGRTALAEDTGVPSDVLLRMVHCCDLCRMTGMAGKTLMRAVAMGYDTLDAFRAATPEQAETDFQAYLRETGERANRMVSFPHFIDQARRLPSVVVQ